MTSVTSSGLKDQPKDEDPEHPGAMVLAKLSDLAREPDCFERLDVLLDGEFQPLRPDFYRWSVLFELDDLQGWLLREGSWGEDAFRSDFPDGIRFVQEILRRRLTHLETRTDPTKLIELWRWATDQAGVREEIRSIWDKKQRELKATLVQSDPLTIPEQEEKFARLLRATADELAIDATARHKLKWAIEALRELAQERCPQERLVRQAFARVVFAWMDQGSATFRRPGVLVTFEFRQKSMGLGAHKVDWFSPKQWFDSDFIQAMGSLLETEGDCFPMSVLQDRLPDLPPGKLSGTSGKLAVAIAQRLANPSAKEIAPCAVPPWVAVTATARSGMASSVDLLRQKLRILRQEGVRVAIVADTQLEITELRAEFHDMHIIAFGGSAEDGATSLRNWRYAWNADLRGLRPRLTRRHLISAVTFAATAGVLGHYSGFVLWRTDQRTPAMKRLETYRDALVKLRVACYKEAVVNLPPNPINPELTWLEGLCRTAYPQDDSRVPKIEVWSPERRPVEANHSAIGLVTLAKHTAFDCSEWVGLKSEDEIRKMPLEAAYSTSVYRFRKQKEGAIRIAFELNSSGFGVVPLLEPGDKLVLGTKPMDEAARITKTSYVIRTISADEPREFEVVIRSIHFNGFQDQQVRGKDSDWCAIRIHPGAQEASLALAQPKKRKIRSIRNKAQRDESKEEDHGVPATAAGERFPDQAWYVWSIDTEGLTRSTVYSMRWKFEQAR